MEISQLFCGATNDPRACYVLLHSDSDAQNLFWDKWRLRFVFVILFVCVWVRILWCINVVVCLHTECAEPRLTGSKVKQTWWPHGSMIRVPLGRCNRVWKRVNWFLLHYVGHVWLTSTCTLYWMSRLWILRLFRCVNRRGARPRRELTGISDP